MVNTTLLMSPLVMVKTTLLTPPGNGKYNTTHAPLIMDNTTLLMPPSNG